MKKNNNLGFMLIETLLVSTFVLGVLTYLFVQFSALKRSYDDDFKYNTIPALYGIKNINQYLLRYNEYGNLINNYLPISGKGYTEIKCAQLTTATSCSDLLQNLNIKSIYLAKDVEFKNNIDDFKENDNTYELYRFIKKISFIDETKESEDTSSLHYHLIAEYNDNTYATISITL